MPAEDEPPSSLQAANVSADTAARATRERRRLFGMGFEATGTPTRGAVTAARAGQVAGPPIATCAASLTESLTAVVPP